MRENEMTVAGTSMQYKYYDDTIWFFTVDAKLGQEGTAAT